MKATRQHGVLAVHPTMKGFGWVLFERQTVPVDWGMASAKLGRNARLLVRFERLLNRYEPATLVLEQFEGDDARRSERMQHLCRAFADAAHCRGMDVHVYGRAAILTVFASIGAKTRYEVAHAIVQRIESFRRWLPKRRMPWMPQDERQSLFDAAALAITHFAVRGGGPSDHPP